MRDLPDYVSKKTPITAPDMNTLRDVVKWVKNQTSPEAYTDDAGAHNRASIQRIVVPFKIVGDTKTGGVYKILIGAGRPTNINYSGTASTALSLTNSINFSYTNRTGFLINTAENGLQIRLLQTNGSVVGYAPIVSRATNSPYAPVLSATIPLPLTLSCTNTAAATNVPVYTLFRHGTSTNQALAVSQTPWRQVSLSGISGTNLPTITAATNCNYFLSGTGVVMAGSGETIPNNLCT
jgi:hypothetical protein